MPVTDQLVARNREYAARFTDAGLPLVPALGLAVIACMDSRLDVHAVLGLAKGDAHVIRNAGGVITDDQIRSLVISQRLLRTREIILIHHTDCGMVTFTDDEMKEAIATETGINPPFAFESFRDTPENVRRSIRRITTSPFIPHTDQVRGFVYDVDTGLLEEVAVDGGPT